MPPKIRNKMSNKRCQLAASDDIPHEVAVNRSSQYSRVFYSYEQMVTDPLSFTPCGKVLSEMDNPSAMTYSTSSGKNKKSNITERVDDDSSQEIDCHPPPDDRALLGAINSESSYEAVALLTRGNTFTQEGLNQALISACRRGHKLLVQTLVQVGANIEHRDEHGDTPLLICAENGFTDIVRFLVSKHANITAVNSVGNTALILSVRSAGSTDLTSFLVGQVDVDVHHENQNGHMALNRATQFMDVDAMRLLLGRSVRRPLHKKYRKGSKCEYDMGNCFFNNRSQEIKQQVIVDETGLGDVYKILQEHFTTRTPLLELAIKAGDTKSFDMFLNCQFSSREEKNLLLNSAYQYVILNHHHDRVQRFSSSDVKILQKLLQYGANVNHGLKHRLISLAVESGNFQVVELLCTHGAYLKDIYSRNEDPPLVIAAKLGRPDLIELLLKYDADIERIDFSGSALDYALRNGHTECAQLLIQRGAKMDVKSALKSAVDHQVPKYMHFLLENFNFDIMNYFSQTPQKATKLVTSAAKQGNCDIIDQILDAGVDVNDADSTGQTPLMASNNREVAEFLIQRGADVNQEIKGKTGSDTVLTYMIKNRKCKDKSTVELCKVLIDNGAMVNYGEDQTPLMLVAAQDDCVDMLQMLLDNGADINDKDSEGNTAFFYSVKRENNKHVRCLLDCSRDKKSLINIQNKEGITPLMFSVQEGYVHMVKELLENGADVNIKDNRENTALHHLLIACYKYIEEILTSLLKAGSHVNWQNSDGLSPLMLATQKTMPSVMSSLLEAEADVNAVSNKNTSQTALSFLSNFKLNLTNNTRSCIETLLNGGGIGSYLGPECIHKLIFGNHVNIILKLIQHGVGPADVDKMQIKIKSSGVPSTVSPLSFALLLGNVHLARYFVEILFLTSSDLSMFASSKFFKCLLPRDHQKDSLRFLYEFSSQPMSLVKLSLVSVSAAVGSSPGRETRVDSLPLPQMMKDRLLFKSVVGERAALAEIPSESNILHDSARLVRLLRDLQIRRQDDSDDDNYISHSEDSDDDSYDAYYEYH